MKNWIRCCITFVLLTAASPAMSTTPLPASSAPEATATTPVEDDAAMNSSTEADPPSSTDPMWVAVSTGGAAAVAGMLTVGPLLLVPALPLLTGAAAVSAPHFLIGAPLGFLLWVGPAAALASVVTAAFVFDVDGVWKVPLGAMGGAAVGAIAGALLGLGSALVIYHGVLLPTTPPPSDPNAEDPNGQWLAMAPGFVLLATGAVGTSIGAGVGAGWSTLLDGDEE